MPRLMTDRLALIPFTLELVEAAMADRAELGRLLSARLGAGWPGPDFAEILPMLARDQITDPERSEWTRLIVRSDDSTIIGDIGFIRRPDADGMVEIGYAIAPPYRGQGYAAEAARALIDWAIGHRGVRRVTAQCLEDNLASIRVLERIGMSRVGVTANMLKWELR